MKKITPFLWFDTQAEEAMNYYVSIFKNSKVIVTSPQMVQFELDGQEFIGLNAGPQFKFNEAVSFFVNCEKKWTSIGTNSSATAEKKVCVVGAKISSGCGGKLSPSNWAN